MDVHHIFFVLSFTWITSCSYFFWWSFLFYRTAIMAIVSPLFVASLASLTLAMTTIGATINLLQQMKILPLSGTCSSCNSPSGSYKTDGLYPMLATTTLRSTCTFYCGWRTRSWWAMIPSWPWWPKTTTRRLWTSKFEGSSKSSRKKLNWGVVWGWRCKRRIKWWWGRGRGRRGWRWQGHGAVLFYDCIGCKAMFLEEGELLQHIVTCDMI